ncbi:hypothetical protein ACVWXQ_004885 [Bradyrhizobium sp. S3.14.4]
MSISRRRNRSSSGSLRCAQDDLVGKRGDQRIIIRRFEQETAAQQFGIDLGLDRRALADAIADLGRNTPDSAARPASNRVTVAMRQEKDVAGFQPLRAQARPLDHASAARDHVELRPPLAVRRV